MTEQVQICPYCKREIPGRLASHLGWCSKRNNIVKKGGYTPTARGGGTGGRSIRMKFLVEGRR